MKQNNKTNKVNNNKVNNENKEKKNYIKITSDEDTIQCELSGNTKYLVNTIGSLIEGLVKKLDGVLHGNKEAIKAVRYGILRDIIDAADGIDFDDFVNYYKFHKSRHSNPTDEFLKMLKDILNK